MKKNITISFSKCGESVSLKKPALALLTFWVDSSIVNLQFGKLYQKTPRLKRYYIYIYIYIYICVCVCVCVRVGVCVCVI